MRKPVIVILILILFLFSQVSYADDSDGDYIPDDWEDEYGLDPGDPDDAVLDPDNDGLMNVEEYIYSTDPTTEDTDGDGYPDKIEIWYYSDPTDEDSIPESESEDPNIITLVTPKYGVGQVSIFNLNISTSDSSICKYHTNPDIDFDDIDSPTNLFTTPDGYTHIKKDFTLSSPDGFEAKFYVKCKTDTGVTNDDNPFNLTLSVDRTMPKISSAMSVPDFVIERLEVILYAETDDKTVCRFTQQNSSPQEFIQYFDNAYISQFTKTHAVLLNKDTTPAIENNEHYLFYVACMNKAGWFSELKKIEFDVNLTYPNEITGTYPHDVIKGVDTNVTVVTNRDSDCFFGEDYLNKFPQSQAKVHFIELEDLDQGTYNYPVQCFFGDGGLLTEDITFLVDTTSPTTTTITSDPETCDNTQLSARFRANDRNLDGYMYRILDSTGNIIVPYTKSDLPNVTETGLTLTRQKTYVWEAYAVDIAGNNGTSSVSTGTMVLSATHEDCRDNSPPYLNISTTDIDNGLRVTLRCYDNEGTCTKTQYALINSGTACTSCSSCTYNTYTSSFTINDNTTICYKITDSFNLTVENSTFVSFIPCTDDLDGCCNKKTNNICDLDCTEAEDSDCAPDKIDTDRDGMPDQWEDQYGLDKNSDADAEGDLDSDGLTNLLEYQNNADPTEEDTDGDGYTDSEEVEKGYKPDDESDYPKDPDKDTDGDTIPDNKEEICGLDPEEYNDPDEDEDEDELTNYEECVTYSRYKLRADKTDTDGDGASDKKELDNDTNPNDDEDFPKTHTLNIILFAAGAIFSVAGGALLIKNMPPPKPKLPKATNKPLVDFNKTKKDMRSESKKMQQVIGPSGQAPAQGNTAAQPPNLDIEIRKRKNRIKMKKMSNIFDEFAKGDSELIDYQQKQKLEREQDPELFEKLDELGDDSFKRLDIVTKKEKLKKRRK
jgi:hypothetical protein